MFRQFDGNPNQHIWRSAFATAQRAAAKVIDVRHELICVDEQIETDAKMAKRVEEIVAPYRAFLDQVSGSQLRHEEQAQHEQRDEHRQENNQTHPQHIGQHDVATVAYFLDGGCEIA